MANAGRAGGPDGHVHLPAYGRGVGGAVQAGGARRDHARRACGGDQHGARLGLASFKTGYHEGSPSEVGERIRQPACVYPGPQTPVVVRETIERKLDMHRGCPMSESTPLLNYHAACFLRGAWISPGRVERGGGALRPTPTGRRAKADRRRPAAAAQLAPVARMGHRPSVFPRAGAGRRPGQNGIGCGRCSPRTGPRRRRSASAAATSCWTGRGVTRTRCFSAMRQRPRRRGSVCSASSVTPSTTCG